MAVRHRLALFCKIKGRPWLLFGLAHLNAVHCGSYAPNLTKQTHHCSEIFTAEMCWYWLKEISNVHMCACKIVQQGKTRWSMLNSSSLRKVSKHYIMTIQGRYISTEEYPMLKIYLANSMEFPIILQKNDQFK